MNTATTRPYPPLPISHRDRSAHDVELLQLVREYGPATLLKIFDGSRPRWASDAATRLLRSGHLAEQFGAVVDEKLELTDAGRRALDASRRPAAA